jgi:hypothetical protein
MISHYILAYLDPTTGSVGYQIALSAALATAAAVRMYWRKLQNLFRAQKPDTDAEKHCEEKATAKN